MVRKVKPKKDKKAEKELKKKLGLFDQLPMSVLLARSPSTRKTVSR